MDPRDAGTQRTPTARGFAEQATEWFAAAGAPDPAGRASRLSELVARHRVLCRLSGEPLIAQMICAIADADPAAPLPGSRARLYDRYLDVRLRGRPAQLRSLLRELAYELQTGAGTRAGYARAYLLAGLERPHGSRPSPSAAGPSAPEPPESSPSEPVPVPVPVPVAVPAEPSLVEPRAVETAVDDLLDRSGLFAVVDGVHVFADPAMREFLAAQEMAGIVPVAVTHGRHLHRRRAWPWPDLRLHLFVATLWLDEGADLGFWLNRLVKGSHAEHNVGFVAELIADGADVPADTRTRLVQELERSVRPPAIAGSEWDRMARMLLAVDREHGLDVLQEIAGSTGRRFFFEHALGLLREFDPARAERAMRRQASDPARKPGRRLRVAQHLAEGRSPERAFAIFAALAKDPHLRGHRVDAALEAARHDPAAGTDLLMTLVRTGGHDRLDGKCRLRAAECVLERDTRRGTEAMAVVSRAGSGEVPPRIRLAAAQRVFEHDAGLGHELLRELAGDTAVGKASVRIEAARRLPSEDLVPCLSLLASAEGGLAPEGALEAAKALYEADRDAGREALDGIVGGASHHPGPAPAGRLGGSGRFRAPGGHGASTASGGLGASGRALLSYGFAARPGHGSAGILPHRPGLQLPHLHAPHPRFSAEHRIKAAAFAASFDQGEHLRHLAGPEGGLGHPDRCAAANALKATDPRAAGECLAALADDWSWLTCSPQQRLELAAVAALLDRSRGAQALTALAERTGMPPEQRLSAALRLAELDPVKATAVLCRLAGPLGLRGDPRLRAALAIGPHARLQRGKALTDLAEDILEDRHVRLSAVEALADSDRRRAAKLCGALVGVGVGGGRGADLVFRRRALDLLCRLDPRRGEAERRAFPNR